VPEVAAFQQALFVGFEDCVETWTDAEADGKGVFEIDADGNNLANYKRAVVLRAPVHDVLTGVDAISGDLEKLQVQAMDLEQSLIV
jgi:hypothetical protein